MKESNEAKARLDAQVDLLNKTLAEEKAKFTTVSNELQRVKQRQILGAPTTSPNATPSSPSKNVSSLETKQLNDEIRTLKAEKAKIESQMAELKRIAEDAEKRMNSANEGNFQGTLRL